MPREPATGHQLYHGGALTPVAAVKVVVAAIGALYITQIILFNTGLIELAAAAGGHIAVGAVLFAFARLDRWTWAHVGVQRTRAVFFIAAGLIGTSLWLVNLVVVAVIQPPGDSKTLQTVVEQTHLAPTILVLALLPAIVEELVFRGVLTRALATKFSPANAIGISAAVFGLYHLLPPQIIATFLTGLALGFVTLRARSVLPAMLAHLLNNVWALVVARDEIPGTLAFFDAHGGTLIATAALLSLTGFVVAARARP